MINTNTNTYTVIIDIWINTHHSSPHLITTKPCLPAYVSLLCQRTLVGCIVMHCNVFEDGSPSFHTTKILSWALDALSARPIVRRLAAVAHCCTVSVIYNSVLRTHGHTRTHTGTHGHTHTQQALIMSFLDLACHNYTFAD